MYAYTTTLAGLAVAAGLAHATPLQDTRSMRLIWRYQELGNSNAVAIDVLTADKSAQLIKHYDCSSTFAPNEPFTIDTDTFADSPLVITVGDKDIGHGGKLEFDGKTYALSYGTDNGGVSCGRLYNDESAVIDCSIPVPSSLKFQTFAVQNNLDCLGTPGDGSVHDGFSTPLDVVEGTSDTFERANRRRSLEVSKRAQEPGGKSECPNGGKGGGKCPACQPCFNFTQTITRDDPVNAEGYDLIIQDSDSLECSSTAGCKILEGSTETHEYGVQITVGGMAGTDNAKGFAMLQFPVNKGSKTKSTMHQCDGNANETICYTYKVPYIAYNAVCREHVDCQNKQPPDYVVHYRIAAPQVKGAHSACSNMKCTQDGDTYETDHKPYNGS